MININSREISFQILKSIFLKGMFCHIVLKETLNSYPKMDRTDKAFISRLTTGTAERKIELDYIIEKFSDIRTEKIEQEILIILRMAIYQLKYMTKVPNSAAVNEAVKIAKKIAKPPVISFVNGVLRAAAEGIALVQYPDEKREPIKYLSIKYSMPEHIVRCYRKQFDFNTVETMLKTFLEDKKTTIRCNMNRITPTELQQSLIAHNINAVNAHYLPYAFYIEDYDNLAHLEEFKQGFFQVQDESSMLVGEVANIKADSVVIDLCAAPGGKTSHISELLKGTGRVYSRDLTEKKVELIKDTVSRLRLNNVEVQQRDALELDTDMLEKADLVIADLPCSGLGVLGKKVDLKYRITPEQIGELIILQKKILQNAVRYLKKGGKLIFSTCTINKKENEKQAEWCVETLGLQAEDISQNLPNMLRKESASQGYIQLLPGIDKTDGFFIAALRRNE